MVNALEAYTQLDIEIGEDGVATVTFDRPDKRNATGAVMHRELSLVFRELERMPTVRVIVLTGKGKVFSSGGDIDWMQEMIDTPSIFERTIREAKEIVLSILDCEKPVIAKVNGHATGLGATLALLCDVVFISEDAKIGDPHVGMGLVAADGGAIIWPQLIGYARAKEYLMTGDLLTAKEAERIGLVNHALAPEALDGAVRAFSGRLANGAQKAIRWTKVTINIGLKQLADQMLDAGLAYELVSNLSPDHRAAVEAYREGRSPIFE